MKLLKTSFFVLIFLFCNNLLSQDSSLSELKFFKIYVTTSDDSLFNLLQDDLGIDPKLDSYLIYVDIRSEESKKQYLVLGDMNHPSSMRFGWDLFSEKVKKGLLNWSKPNKMPADK